MDTATTLQGLLGNDLLKVNGDKIEKVTFSAFETEF